MSPLHFVVTARGQTHRTMGHFVLLEDNWNDYGYFTLFHLYYNGSEGEIEIGQVKIANVGMSAEFRYSRVKSSTTTIPRTFAELSSESFSLGQDREYYENLRALPDGLGAKALHALNDVAANSNLFERFAEEDVFQTALMRDLSKLTVETQFRRIIAGETALTPYRFSFSREPSTDQQPPLRLDFGVHPACHPPTNIHVIIGANGVGKSKLLREFVAAVANPGAPSAGAFRDEIAKFGSEQATFPFAGLVHVAFSAFETDTPVHSSDETVTTIKLVGLVSNPAQPLEVQFTESLRLCRSGPRRIRWLKAMGLLSAADANLNEIDFVSLLDSSIIDASRAFASMSSGHKIVVLTMSRLVELIEERTLVLFDEPETHLHPPLLSALICAVSDLVIGRNGVAIIATHSPVVLQEVPRSCVHVLRRAGNDVRVSQLDTESFGESVSRLTSEVFHLAVGQTGYHRALNHLLAEHNGDSEKVLEVLGGQLGSEGRFVLNALAQGHRTNA